MGHCNFNYIFDYGSNMLHLRMPLYFFLSGIFFKDYGGCIKTLLRKCDKLLLPFIFFLAVNIIISYVMKAVSHSPLPELSEFFPHGRISILSIWFLLSLFWLSTLYSIAYAFTDKIMPLAIISLCFSAIGITLSRQGIILPLYLDSTLSLSPFFFMGICLKRTSILTPNSIDRYNIPIAVVLFIAAGLIGYANNLAYLNWSLNKLGGNIALHFLQTCLVVFAMILLCKSINRLPLVSYIGRYSIIILVTHGIYIRIVTYLSSTLGLELNTSILFTVVLSLCILSIEPMRRFLPHVTAQKNLLSAKIQ